jgi:hypothetical protein
MWASQLLTLNATVPSRRDIIYDFTSVPNYVRVERIELVMFNCPEKGISVQTINISAPSLLSETISPLGIFNVFITSCDSLVRVCIPRLITQPVIFLRFTPPAFSTWVYLAEVEFYGEGSTCQPDTIITTPTPTSITTSCKCIKNIRHHLHVCNLVISLYVVQPFPIFPPNNSCKCTYCPHACVQLREWHKGEIVGAICISAFDQVTYLSMLMFLCCPWSKPYSRDLYTTHASVPHHPISSKQVQLASVFDIT